MRYLLLALGLLALVATGIGRTSGSYAPESCVRFAVVGDYGEEGTPEADVAELVTGWQPEFIITVGDNNYPDGEASTIDGNVGQYYHSYIYPYNGGYGSGADMNRFFPVLGNHDWHATGAEPYLDYFELPNNERYYDFVWGPVHFFMIDSDDQEPDGAGENSEQAQWFYDRMASSTAPWQVVVLHHPPYSSGLEHGSTPRTQWPFDAHGIDAVLAGHDHIYERLEVDGIPYIVNGLGGRIQTDGFADPLPESQVRYNGDYGAMDIYACADSIEFQFITRSGSLIDSLLLTAEDQSSWLYLPLVRN